MIATPYQKPTAAAAEPSSDFDVLASRDLDLLLVADGHLREAWRALTPPAVRSVVAAGCILEIGAMLGDLASELRRIEDEQAI